MTRTLTIVRALGAALALLALVFEAPVLLASFGDPIGDVIDAFGDELSSDTSRSEALLVAALVIIGWIAWAMMAMAVVNEIVAAVRGRMARPLPLLPGVQVGARTLVTSVTLLTTLVNTTHVAAAPLAPTDPVVALVEPEAVPIPTEVAAPTPTSTGPSYRVVRSDTWWSMAERLLGSGNRWQEIVTANEGRRMVNGTVVTASTPSPRPGWVVQLPADAVLPLRVEGDAGEPASPSIDGHVVVAGDTLWDIASSRLPAGASTERVQAAVASIVDANISKVQPDGRKLTDPSVLEPGWTLTIPAFPQSEDAEPEASDMVVVERGDTLWELAETHLDSGERFLEIVDRNLGVPQPDGRALQDPDLILPGWRLEMPTTEPAVAEAPAERERPPEPPVPEPALPEDEAIQPSPAPMPPATTLTPPDLAPAPPPPPPASTPTTSAGSHEAGDDAGSTVPIGLLAAGLATAGVVTVLDRRRRVQRQLRRSGHVLPTPTAEAEQADLRLRAGADVDGAERVAVAMQAAAAGLADGAFPAVRFVTVSADAVQIHLGEVVSAVPDGFDEVDGTWLTTLAHDELEALAHGVVDPLPLLCPIGTTPEGADVLVDLDRYGISWIDGPQERVMGLVRSMALALSSSAWADSPRVIAVGMSGGIAELDWVESTPTLVEALAAVCRTLPTTPWRRGGIEVDAGEPIAVVSATSYWEVHKHQLEEISAAVPSGTAVVLPGPSLDGPGTVITVDEHGHIDCPGIDVEVVAASLDDDDVRVVVDLLEEASQIDADLPASVGTPAGVRPLPTLEDELRSYEVLVRVMGDVTVERLPDGEDAQPVTFERARSEEAVVYLAAREEGRGVDGEDVRAALWPDGMAADQTVRNTMTAARRGLGEDLAGEPYLPQPTDGRYQLSNRVVTDFELFWSMRQTANHVDAPDLADHLLDQALQLVRGEPFLGSGRGYAWTSTIGTTIIVAVVDAAEQVGLSRLVRNDPKGAERAARAGLRISPGDERLYRILLRAAAAQDSKPMVERLYRELLDVLADPDLGIEPEDTVSQETVDVFNELMGRRRKSA